MNETIEEQSSSEAGSRNTKVENIYVWPELSITRSNKLAVKKLS